MKELGNQLQRSAGNAGGNDIVLILVWRDGEICSTESCCQLFVIKWSVRPQVLPNNVGTYVPKGINLCITRPFVPAKPASKASKAYENEWRSAASVTVGKAKPTRVARVTVNAFWATVCKTVRPIL